MVFDPIGLAGELGDGTSFERKTLEQLGELIGFDAAFFATKTALPRNQALFVGSGGAVAMRQFATVCPGMKLDVLELDARVVVWPRRHPKRFGFD